MLIKRDTPKWKIHLFFASLMLVAFSLEFTIRLLLGAEAKEAASGAVKQVNLFWILFYLAIWYCAATGKLQNEGERKSNLITLHLNDKDI